MSDVLTRIAVWYLLKRNKSVMANVDINIPAGCDAIGVHLGGDRGIVNLTVPALVIGGTISGANPGVLFRGESNE